METYIEYYYGFSGIKCKIKGDYNYFNFNGYSYVLCPLVRKLEEIEEIARISGDFSDYDKIIRSLNGNLIIDIYNKKYLLIKKNKSNSSDDIFKFLYNPHKIISDSNMTIDKSNWIEMWSNKIDNVEYQLSHINDKYPMLKKYSDYYIGMAENAIIYIRRAYEESYSMPNKIVSHIRIKKDWCTSPQNIIVDNEGRDISEYMKYIFFINAGINHRLIGYLIEGNLSDITLRLIYGRLYFPTFFFDICDDIMNGLKKDEEIMQIVSRSQKYEEYLEDIYSKILEQKKIPKIVWKGLNLY